MIFTKFLAVAIGSSVFLYITLRIWGALTGEAQEAWKPVVASLVNAVCFAFLSSPWNSAISLVLVPVFLRFVTAAAWSDIVYPVLITRLGLVAVLIPFAATGAR